MYVYIHTPIKRKMSTIKDAHMPCPSTIFYYDHAKGLKNFAHVPPAQAISGSNEMYKWADGFALKKLDYVTI